MSFQEKITLDRFGNSQMIKGMKSKMEDGSFPKCYATLGGKLYKFELSPSRKEGVEDWLTITAMKKKTAKMVSM